MLLITSYGYLYTRCFHVLLGSVHQYRQRQAIEGPSQGEAGNQNESLQGLTINFLILFKYYKLYVSADSLRRRFWVRVSRQLLWRDPRMGRILFGGEEPWRGLLCRVRRSLFGHQRGAASQVIYAHNTFLTFYIKLILKYFFRYYLKQFGDRYPKQRKAVIPYML